MAEVFVDTSGWATYFVRTEPHHASAVAYMRQWRAHGTQGLFVDQKVHETSLRMLVLEIARLQGELRLVHLKTHVAMQHALSPQQIAQYDELRG